MNEILVGDAAEVLKTFESESIDLTVTSPPYDDLRKYNGYVFDAESIIEELFRVTKSGGVVVWVVGDQVVKGSETGTSFRQALKFMEVGFRLHDTMIYEKAGASNPSNNRYCQIFEYMFVLSKGKPKTTNLFCDKPNRWAGHSSFGSTSNRNSNGVLVSKGKRVVKDFGIRNNIWRYANGFGFGKSDKTSNDHPAVFPENLAKDHVLSWSNLGDIVLDPMCGSGTTLKMAKETGRDYIGIEISPEYAEIARQRLE